ncbi:MAG: hypothetical protein D6B25_00075 [Desulfobulbaceae bacterium]|nr:MAG: hypothetical protein D6B25_00075 [Desulfobulbaceae bacterium]
MKQQVRQLSTQGDVVTDKAATAEMAGLPLSGRRACISRRLGRTIARSSTGAAMLCLCLVAGLIMAGETPAWAKKECTKKEYSIARLIFTFKANNKNKSLLLGSLYESATARKRCKKGGREVARQAACQNGVATLQRSYGKLSRSALWQKACASVKVNGTYQLRKIEFKCYDTSKPVNVYYLKSKGLDNTPFICTNGKAESATVRSTWPGAQ